MSVAEQTGPAEEYLEEHEPARVRIVLIAVATTLLFASLGQTIVTTAMPIMVADLGGLDHITWVITAYLLASTIGAPIAGKLGDLYGRKIVIQVGIGVFMVGAVIGGLAQNMGMLVAGRAVQGFGGGGLIVVSMAVVADVLPARERGKAQGLMGAMFGISTVIGPLIGGFLVQALSWHWIFFVNLPVGVLALIVLGVALDNPTKGIRHPIDYAGAVLLSVILASAVLVSNMGGTVYGWGSPQILALIALGLGAVAGFVIAERRAAEPILPPKLFTINTFLVVNGVGFMVGMAMFGTITFLPLFLQVVKGLSPATSGMFLTPMMAGLLGASMGAGLIMSRTGRYKLLPILSTALLTVSMLGMSTLAADTPLWLIATMMVGVGLGLGPVFSIGVAAIQNAVPVTMLGVGTASANMFRLIGGSIGTAAFGAIFSAGLARNLGGLLPDGAGLRSMSAETVAALDPEAQVQVMDGISNAMHPIFLIAATVGAIAFLLSFLLKELPLSNSLPGRPVTARG
ncbi:MDR family MFS transporter [Pelagovum pacificum]|uniref:MFS transporter n=1 Tax=Pelagovum pacificum TaxID=2588711 RepID=A0A5C5G8Q4_9RHOB|nr:MDR family MFS transporter [Pelagovum pacificum]QQA41652.1 MFS transporter [Pelagovum pacificum]TNY30931.1 MFS transporter [Pelagovum pacificum]